jgi:hypothetical protein
MAQHGGVAIELPGGLPASPVLKIPMHWATLAEGVIPARRRISPPYMSSNRSLVGNGDNDYPVPATVPGGPSARPIAYITSLKGHERRSNQRRQERIVRGFESMRTARNVAHRRVERCATHLFPEVTAERRQPGNVLYLV